MRTSANSLTEGALSRSLLGLAGPMFVGAMLQNLQSLIDLFWVGRLGSPAVAALALSGTILMMMFPVVMGMSAGTVAFVSRNVGAGNHERASDAAGQSLGLAAMFGAAAGIAGMAFTPVLCRLLGAGPDILPMAVEYLRISFAGSFTIFLLFVANSVLQSAGNSVLPMMVLGLANLLNIVLDPVLIYGLLGLPAMGVAGAALATVVSQAAAAVVVLIRLARGSAGIQAGISRWKTQPALAWQILRIGLPSSGQMLSRTLMSLVLMRIVAACGTSAVAAYGIGTRFHMILLMPSFALGNSAATLVGQNLGAGKPARANTAAWLATGIGMAIMAVSALALYLWAPQLVRCFDGNPAVVSIGSTFLRIASPFYVFASMGIILGRALIGAGDSMGPMITTIAGLWGVQVPLAILLPRLVTPPTSGIWWSVAAALAVNGALTTAWFQTGRWRAKRLG